MDGESIPASGVVIQLSEQLPSRHNNGHCNRWTEERRAILKTMWADGKSGRQIAERLGGGVTRNAVIGMVHRMGLQGRPTRIRMSKKQHCAVRLKFGKFAVRLSARQQLQAWGRMTAAPLPPPDVTDVARKCLNDLEDNDCRYPIGEPGAAQHYCALPRSERKFLRGRSPYCEGHHARCINDVS